MKPHPTFFRAASSGILIALGYALLVLSPPALHGSLASEVIERLVRTGGHFVDDAGRGAAKEALERAIEKYGAEVVDMAEHGGFGLAKAAAAHGDNVWRIARLSAEAPSALAARSESILAVAQRWGDDAALLEIKAPGCGEVLGAGLGGAELRSLAAAATPREIFRLGALAAHQGPMELKAAATLWKRGGGRVLEFLTPGRIAASGFALAAMIAAWRAPESILGLIESALQGFLGPLVVVSSWSLVLLILVLLRQPVLWLIAGGAALLRSTWQVARKDPSDPPQK